MMADKADLPSSDDFVDLRTLSRICGLREDFLSDLLFIEANDWSFVIKAHALLESVVCQLLATRLRQPDLEYVLAQKVEMEARVQMLKALGAADKGQRQMIRLLGKIRNHLVHNAKQTDFRFDEYLRNKDNRHNFIESFAGSWPDQIPGTSPPVSRADYVVRKPRYAIWMSVIGIVALTLNEKLRATFEEQRKLVFEALSVTTVEASSTAPKDS